MKIERRKLTGFAVVALMIMATISFAFDKPDKAAHVRWDIISLVFGTPNTLNPGGVAFAKTDGGSTIKLTGSGTFVAPAGRHGKSGAATGGGTWETFDPAGTSTGSGNYVVEGLVRFELANFFTTGGDIDNIGDISEAANASAYVEVEYDDGSRGILGIGCHGPGAPPGIDEGVIATKGFVTYWNSQNPAPGVDANRTVFHVRQK